MTKQKNKQNGRKYLVYACMVAVFGGCMWLIFAPGAADRERVTLGTGFNSAIPDPRGAAIVGDKKTAYEAEQQRLRQQQQMSSLGDVARMLAGGDESPEERAARQARELRMAPKPPEYYDNPARFEGRSSSRGGSGIHKSTSAHTELTETISGFFSESAAEPEPAPEPPTAEVDELTLLEKTFEIASRYAPVPATATAAEPIQPTGRKTQVEPVLRESRSVVSRLAGAGMGMGAGAGVETGTSRGFITATAPPDTAAATPNTIAAEIDGDQRIKDGQTIRLRTTEPMRAGRRLIPAGTILTGEGRISGERLTITVTAIEHAGSIIPVELAAHDSDGQRGLHIPGSLEIDALKEIVGGMGQGLGSTISLSQQSAGEQLLADLGRGVIQGTSQYVSKKARQIKVTLKAGHKVYLLPNNQ